MSNGKALKGSMKSPIVNKKLEPTTELWRISQHCFMDEIRSKMTLPKKLQLCDITLREGRQLPGVSLRRDEVILIADKLVEAGVSPRCSETAVREAFRCRCTYMSVRNWGMLSPGARWLRISVRMKRVTAGITSRISAAHTSVGIGIYFAFLIVR